LEPEGWHTVEWTDGETAMLVVDRASGRIVDANPAAEAFLRQPRPELLQRAFAEVVSSEDIFPFLDAAGEPVFEPRGDAGSALMPGGRARAVPLGDGGACLVSIEVEHVARPDIEMRRMTWALEAYARSSKALIRSNTLSEMAERVCQAIVEHDDYALATIVMADLPPSKAVRPIASAGDAVGYLEGLDLSIDESIPEGRGPTGRALRSGMPLLMNDSLRDPIFDTWRDRAIRFGLRSSTTVPFRHGDLRGAIMVYAARPSIFTEREVHIFRELGDELAFAINVLLARARLDEERHARARAEAELQAKQAEVARIARALSVGEFAATIAHEITQPLAAVITNIETAQRFLAAASPNMERVRAAMDRALRDADRAADVIRQTRRFVARAEEDFAINDINAIIDPILGHGSVGARNPDIDILVELAPDLPLVRCSAIQIQQVLVNLFVNAREAMEDVPDRRSRIEVRSARTDSGGVLVTVADNAGGMSEETRKHVFEPMYTSKKNGMGLGLSISRSIVEAHGGKLWCEPAEPVGTVFCMSLPAAGSGEEDDSA
jgi:signal transduction histidine kinase